MTLFQLFLRLATASLGILILVLLWVTYLVGVEPGLWRLALVTYSAILILPPTLLLRVRAIGMAAFGLRMVGFIALVWNGVKLSFEDAAMGEFLTLRLFVWIVPLMAAFATFELWQMLRPSHLGGVLGVTDHDAQQPVATDAPHASRR